MATMEIATEVAGLNEAKKVTNNRGKSLMVIGTMNNEPCCYFPNVLSLDELRELRDFLNGKAI